MCFTTLLYLDTSNATDTECERVYTHCLPSFSVDFYRFKTFTSLITHLYTLNKYTYNSENEHISNDGPQYDVFYPVVVILQSQSHSGPEKSGVACMKLQDKMFFLSTTFHPLNVTVRETNGLDCTALDASLKNVYNVINQRFRRVEAWIGLFNDVPTEVPTMPKTLKMIDNDKGECNRNLAVVSNEVSFLDLLDLRKPTQFYVDLFKTWTFTAHTLKNDELLYCAFLMIREAFGWQSDESLVPKDNQLLAFLFCVRDNYRYGNGFHNFRHAVDVLQATYYLLKCLVEQDVDAVPVSGNIKGTFSPQQVAYLLPAEVRLTLMIASLGHDIGHPGTTNAFLVEFKTPTAEYFNNQSVLENFHFKQFKFILSKALPQALEIEKRTGLDLVEKSIIATDMMRHQAYLGKVNQVLSDGCSSEECSMILCSVLIKCADISNVARPLPISAKWGVALNNEFGQISHLEKVVKGEIKGEDFKPKVNFAKLANITPEDAMAELPGLSGSQIWFITEFGLDFFSKVSQLMPSLKFMIDNIETNMDFWKAQTG